MLYLLDFDKPIQLKEELKAEAIAILRSASLTLIQKQGATWINFLSAGENIVLHISIRPSQNVVVFNSRTKNGSWGPEERVSLEGKFQSDNPSITVYDHGDRYQILFDYATVLYYNKRIQENVTSISYNIDAGQVAIFSDPLSVDVYPSFASIAPRGV